MKETERYTALFKALSDPTRFKLLKLLSNCRPGVCKGGPLCVNALSRELGVTQSAVSQHLRVLKHAGIVHGERHGSFMHYSLDPKGIEKCKAGLMDVFGEVTIGD